MKPEEGQTATAMPEDRKAASYSIYSMLMPLGETAGKNWPHKLWLVQDITVSVIPANEPCRPVTSKDDRPLVAMTMNPHVAVKPAGNQAQDFVEILEDWDRHCHDRILLDRDGWHTLVPVVLLDSKARADHGSSRNTVIRDEADHREVDKYEGAPSLYGFSPVFFNKSHTVALVYLTHYCGGLCGEGFWVALALENGRWKQLQWDCPGWIS